MLVVRFLKEGAVLADGFLEGEVDDVSGFVVFLAECLHSICYVILLELALGMLGGL